jgi:uncharacterized protein YjiS (DUF1127 family)
MRTTARRPGLDHETSILPLKAGAHSALSVIVSAWRSLRNRAAINELLELDDDQLLDIGLTRADVQDAFVTSSFFEDPSGYLWRSARRRARAAIHRSL